MKQITLLFIASFLLSQIGIAQLYDVDDTDTTPFEDISTTGTALGLGDDGEATIATPFMFVVDGVPSSDFVIGNNGAILFNATTGNVGFTNNALAPMDPAFIAPFWDDIDSDSGDVFWEVRGTAPDQRLIVQWDDRPHFNNIGSSTFQAVFFEGTNEILYAYEDVLFENATFDNGASATVGIAAPNDFVQYSFNEPIITNGLAIRFTPVIPPSIMCSEDIQVNVMEGSSVVVPIGVTTTYTPDFGTLPESTIDGSGLSEFPSATATHDDTTPANSFVTSDAPTGSFDFDLGGTMMINGLSIWNQNAGGPGGAGSTGIQDIVVSSSTDGVAFTPIPGGPTSVAQVMSNGPIGPEQFSFDDVEASFIRLQVSSNYGDTFTGFAEIIFTSPIGGEIGCEAIVDYSLPVVTGTSNTATQTEGLPSGSAFPVGTTTNTFEVMDDDGNILTCTFDVTVIDDSNPTIECPEDTVVNAETGDTTVELPDFTGDAVADDNCPDFTVTQDPAAGTVFDTGTVETVTITVTDASGNETSCSFEVTLDFSLSNDAFNLNNSIAVYPNPTRGLLNITNANSINLTTATITDLNGRTIQTIPLGDTTSNQLSLENLSNGLYFIRINSENASIVRRIIKN